MPSNIINTGLNLMNTAYNGQDGIVLSGDAVKGGYFVTDYISEVLDDNGNIIYTPPIWTRNVGTICYNKSDKKFYQFDGITWGETEFDVLGKAIEDEEKRAKGIENSLRIALNGEIQLREAQVNGLNFSLKEEINRAIGAEGALNSAIKTEESRARSEEAALGEMLDKEANILHNLIGEDEEKTVRQIANEELAAQLLSGKADADFETLQQLAAWLEDHPESVAEINRKLDNHTHNITYTPKGDITDPVFTGTSATISMTGTPEGDISQAEFTGTKETITVSGTPTGAVSQPTFTGEELTSIGNYTPAGTISDITAEFAPTHDTVSYVTDVGSPSTMLATYDASKQKLTLAFTKGSNIKYSTVTVVTGGEVSVSKPTFTGTDATISVSGTPKGTVSQPTFSGNTLTSTGDYTPAGTISEQTFTGEDFTVTSDYTPAGSINELTFTGTQETLATTVAKMPEVVTNG